MRHRVISAIAAGALALPFIFFGAPVSQADAIVSGTISTDTVWKASDGVIVVTSQGLTVTEGATLTMEAGTIVKVDNSCLNIQGSLVVHGTQDSPVTITSYQDDSVGGDTDQQPQPIEPLSISQWCINGLQDSVIDINQAKFTYFSGLQAGNPDGGLGARSVTVTNSTITGSRWGGHSERWYLNLLISAYGTQGDVLVAGNTISELRGNSIRALSQLDGGSGFISVQDTQGSVIIADNVLTRDDTFKEAQVSFNFIGVSGCINPEISGNVMEGWAQNAVYLGCESVDANLLSGNLITNPESNGGLVLDGWNGWPGPVSGLLTSQKGNVVPELRYSEVPDGKTLTIDAYLVRMQSLVTEGSGKIVIQDTKVAPAPLFASDTMTVIGNDSRPGIGVYEGGTLVVDNAEFVSNSSSGVGWWNGIIQAEKAKSVQIRNSIFRNLFGPAISIQENQEAPVISWNEFYPSEGGLALVNISSSPVNMGTVFGNTVAGTSPRSNSIMLSGDILSVDGSLPWGGNMVPVVDGLVIPEGRTLNLRPGTVIKIVDWHGIDVWGTLNSSGTDDNPVVFTAMWDDSVGGVSGWPSYYEKGRPNGTFVEVKSEAEGAAFDRTVFMNAGTAIYVNEHTDTYVTNSKFISNNQAIGAYDANDRYQDSDFESKYFQAALTIITHIFGARTDCNPPYNDEMVLMQGNWFGELGFAGVEMGSMPDTTGNIQLGNTEISLEKILDGVQMTFAPTADPEQEPEQYKEQEDQLQKARDEATDKYDATEEFLNQMKDILLIPGSNSIPVTKWTCQVLGQSIPMTSTPVRHLHLAALDMTSEIGLTPTFPPGIENVPGSFIGAQQWLDEEPFLESTPIEESSNADLARLVIVPQSVNSSGFGGNPTESSTMVPPQFDPGIAQYTMTVPYEVTSAMVDELSSENFRSRVDYNWDTCDYTFGDFPCNRNLAVGDNKLEIVVTAEDGTIKAYHVNVIREAPHADPALVEIAFAAGGLSPNFDSEVTHYTLTLDQPILWEAEDAKEDIEWSAAARDQYAAINWVTGDSTGVNVGAGGTFAIDLVRNAPAIGWEGSYQQFLTDRWHWATGSAEVSSLYQTSFQVHVVAQDGVTERVYTFDLAAPPIPVDVIFDGNGGLPAQQVVTVNAGETVSLPTPPKRSGYAFMGWRNKYGDPFDETSPIDPDYDTITLYANWDPLYSGIPQVEEKVNRDSSATGGSARAADGKDSYLLTVTLTTDTNPVVGAAGNLGLVLPDGVTASTFRDNNDGTYTAELTSATPGNYQVQVMLDGETTGVPISVNYIGAQVPTGAQAGGQITVRGLGFVPGEPVTVRVDSLGLDLGEVTADSTGTVVANLDIPAEAQSGPAEVAFTGKESGAVSASFTVTAAPIQTRTVTFDSNDGSIPSFTVVTDDGGTVTLPPDPTRDGFAFTGWNTNVDGTGLALDASTAVTADLTVYAQWEGVSQLQGEVRQDEESSVTGGSARMADGKDSYVLTVMVRNNAEPMVGSANNLSLVLPDKVSASAFQDHGDGTYTVGLTSEVPGSYQVQVMLNGEAAGVPITVNYIGTQAPNKAQVGTQVTVRGLGFVPGEKVAVLVELLGLDLGEIAADDNGTVEATIDVPADAQAGLTSEVVFAGAESGSATASFTVTATPIQPHSVTFDTNGGSTSSSVITTGSDGAIVLPADPTKDGFVFKEWNTKVDGTGQTIDASTIVAADMTVYAQWKVPQLQGEVKVNEESSVTGGSARTADGRDSYLLTVTVRNNDGLVVGSSDHLSAVVPDGVTVSSFRDNVDGTYTAELTSATPGNYQVQVMLDGEAVGVPVSANFIGAQAPDMVQVGASVTVSGLGFVPGEKVSVRIDSLGLDLGQVTADSNGTVTTSFDVPEATKAGVDVEVAFTGEQSGSTTTSFTVAQAPSATLIVTYDPNGGTGVVTDAASYYRGDQATVKANGFTRDGYEFSSWNTATDGEGTSYAPGDSLTLTGDVTLYAQWAPVTQPTEPTQPSQPPTSEVAKEEMVATTTGGAARIADGKDSYALVTTLTSGAGLPMIGLAGHLGAVVPDGVTVSSFVDNSDGTYEVEVASTVPGNYLVTVTLDAIPVGAPIPVNFIGATIVEPVRLAGQSQSATGLGFLPGEQVSVTVHSDPIALGVFTADAHGNVPVAFDVPADFVLGRHTVDFTGAISGKVSVGFSVVASTNAPVDEIQTGGTAQGHGFLLMLSGTLVVAGLCVGRTRTVF